MFHAACVDFVRALQGTKRDTEADFNQNVFLALRHALPFGKNDCIH